MFSRINIQVFDSLNFVYEHFDNEGVGSVIEKCLGQRSISAKFNYAEVIKNMWMIYFCGDDCAEDIQTHLRPSLCET